MLDFEVQRCTRRCAATDREFKPGEVVYSVLVPRGAEVVRQDFAADAWPGPPENAIGWWKGRVPDGAQPKQSWAPNDVMLDYFQRLADQPDKADACYVLALLLIRRRVLKLEEGTSDSGDELSVFCARNEKVYRIPAVLPDDARVQQIQAELRAALSGAGESLPPSAAAPATVVDHLATDPSAADQQLPDQQPANQQPAGQPLSDQPAELGPGAAAESSDASDSSDRNEPSLAREPEPVADRSPVTELPDDALTSLAGLLSDEHVALTETTRELNAS